MAYKQPKPAKPAPEVSVRDVLVREAIHGIQWSVDNALTDLNDFRRRVCASAGDDKVPVAEQPLRQTRGLEHALEWRTERALETAALVQHLFPLYLMVQDMPSPPTDVWLARFTAALRAYEGQLVDCLTGTYHPWEERSTSPVGRLKAMCGARALTTALEQVRVSLETLKELEVPDPATPKP